MDAKNYGIIDQVVERMPEIWRTSFSFQKWGDSGFTSKTGSGDEKESQMNFSDDNKNSNVVCSFCGKRGDQVKRMLAGRNGYICDRCV